MDVRQLFGWTGMALFYASTLFALLAAAWAFVRLARRDLSLANMMPSLMARAGAVGGFGIGLATASLDVPVLTALGTVIVFCSVAIWIFGPGLMQKMSRAITDVVSRGGPLR